jgi:hypothetical protein
VSPTPTVPPQPADATPRDRRQLLLEAGATVNGIDFVEVDPDQTALHVHFLNQVPLYDPSAVPPVNAFGSPDPVTIAGGEVIATVAVDPVDPATDIVADTAGRPVVNLTVAAPGDFSTYTLTIASPVLDPLFQSMPFSFKANCATTIDCATPPVVCPPSPPESVTIDYTAKDFGSFTRALSEFSATRYPAWVERSEADLGIVLMEAMAAVADELSYYQDRVANEAHIATATQRVSVVRQARLVDYEPSPATAALVQLQLDVDTRSSGGTPTTLAITDPVHVQAIGPDSVPIDFEVGDGLVDPATGRQQSFSYPVDSRWNRWALGVVPAQLNLPPYWLDDTTRCLPAGATQLYLGGWGHALQAGQQLLLDTQGATSADPAVREVVTIATPYSDTSPQTMLVDPLFDYEITLVELAAPTTLDHDLSVTQIAGNLVPAVQGLSTTEWFWIPTVGGSTPRPPFPSNGEPVAGAVVRQGPNSTPCEAVPVSRYSLSQTPLAWYPVGATEMTSDDTPAPSGAGQADTAVTAWPELVLEEVSYTGGPVDPNVGQWPYARWLLDTDVDEAAFTLTPEQYSPVLTSGGSTWYDYDGDGGTTVTFGDGVFGVPPVPGALFSAHYRVGGGQRGNVPAGAITTVVSAGAAPTVLSCTNPFPGTGGADEETNAQVAVRAPQQFAAEPLRVVRASDYVAAVASLPFVQQAGTSFRWTGSWLTVFTAANAKGAEQPSLTQMATVTDLLNQRRLAGYESYVLPPAYVSIDLTLVVCAEPSAFNADVGAAVRARLEPGTVAGVVGFFDHANWGFGQPLEASALLAAVQGCPGVAGVYDAQYRQRGVQPTPVELPDVLEVGPGAILRVDSDPSRPDAGSLSITVEGGK